LSSQRTIHVIFVQQPPLMRLLGSLKSLDRRGAMNNRQYIAKIYPLLILGSKRLYLIAVLRFTYVPAYKKGPSYSDGVIPPESERVEDVELVSLTVDDEDGTPVNPIPFFLDDWICKNVNKDRLLD